MDLISYFIYKNRGFFRAVVDRNLEFFSSNKLSDDTLDLLLMLLLVIYRPVFQENRDKKDLISTYSSKDCNTVLVLLTKVMALYIKINYLYVQYFCF